jgi:hypothetical protein
MSTTQLNTVSNEPSGRPVDVALSYARGGIRVFPCREKEGYSKYANPKTGEFELKDEKTPIPDRWKSAATKAIRNVGIVFGERHPTALVAIPTGMENGVWVLDLDRHNDRDGHLWLAEMEAKHGPLPETAQVTTANGGTHYFFRHVDGVRNRAAIAPGVDTRGEDGYVIAAGSVMADGRRYTWQHDWDGDGLPPMADAPQWLLALVVKEEPEPSAVAGVRHVYELGENISAYDQHAIQGILDDVAQTPVGERGYEVYVKSMRLGEFVAAGAISRSDAEQQLYAAAEANGVVSKDGPRATKDKIRRGLDKTKSKPRIIPESSYANDNTVADPKLVAGVLAGAERKKAAVAEPANDNDTGAAATAAGNEDPDWGKKTLATLQVRHGGEVRGNKVVGATVRGQKGNIWLSGYDIMFESASGRSRMIGFDEPLNANEPLAEIDYEPEIEFKLEDVSDLESLTRPGGLVENLIDWIVSSADRPSRPLALAAVLPFVAALAGPRFATGTKATRPNIYTVALAGSGYGKDHARSRIKNLFMHSEGVFDRYCGPERIMSASALREVLEEHQSVVCQIDEFGSFVRDITDRTAGMHQRAISTDLRDYYSASTSFFGGAAYKGHRAKRIYNPNLCVHGTSTPEQFWSALSSASAEDGLLPRLVLFHIKGPKPPSVTPQNDVYHVPDDLLLRLADVAGINVAKARATGLGGKIEIPAFKPNKPTVVPWDDGAKRIFSSLKKRIEEMESSAPENVAPFINRILETTTKLALIVAIGTDPASPEITGRIMEWATRLAWACAAAMLDEVGERLSDNQREANYKRISTAVKKAGKSGITEGRIANSMKSIDTRQRDEIIKDLKLSGHVKTVVTTTKGRSSNRLVWFEFET